MLPEAPRFVLVITLFSIFLWFHLRQLLRTFALSSVLDGGQVELLSEAWMPQFYTGSVSGQVSNCFI